MPPRRMHDNFVQGDSDSDVSIFDDADEGIRAKGKGKAKAIDRRKKDKGRGRPKRSQPYAWEASYTRSWDTVQEDEAGSLQGAVQDLIARGRRRRLLAPAAAIRRTIIRHLVLLLDLSSAMMDRDMRPTRFDLMLQYVREFVTEWFDQNPLGQIGIVGMRGGIGERIGEMTGTATISLRTVSRLQVIQGNPQEILIIFGSLTTCDPGNIHDTLGECVKDRIRISVVALAAEMKICRNLCVKTGGQFGVALNEGHFKDLLFELIPPPAQRALARTAAAPAADLMLMGFPTRLPDTSPPGLCVCHSQLRSAGFLCPRCAARVCDVPTDCDICGLMIVSAPHLARSYHHLFPVKAYQADVLLDEPSPTGSCHGCAAVFRKLTTTTMAGTAEGVSPLGRYRCPDCRHDFCADCDVFVHDVVHCCPGCGK
ncbi:Ssl1-like-domain-containing protein [Amylocystis lapponica]|nr:Ssl1-like-domain-containing protein [Amylocystis lapponica]